MQFHQLDRARDPNFWSVRVSRDIRLIVHRTASSLLLCYVDHHDRAYAWAERRKLEIHPITGAAQLVEIRELVREVTVERYVEREPVPAAKPRLFEAESDESLLSYGVPPEWLEEVRSATEDTVLELADHLLAEAAAEVEGHRQDVIAAHNVIPAKAGIQSVGATAWIPASAGMTTRIRFLTTEWEEVVDAWGLDGWDAYRDVTRLGRKTRLPEAQRAVLWEIFALVRARLAERGLVTRAGLFNRLALHYDGAASPSPPYDFVVVDEAQDVSVVQLRFLASLGRGRANALFFAGDLGQRIFQTPFSWKSLGVDVRGRSRVLRINYRTSHQIRAQADRLLGPSVSDVDGIVEDRRGTVSVFNGAMPEVRVLASEAAEGAYVGTWLAARVADGVLPAEIGVFVRSSNELSRPLAAVSAAGLVGRVLDDRVGASPLAEVSISTMHLAKGLEFRAVAVMACDDSVLPLQSRIESVSDETDLEEVYDTERHLLYVACTRARDYLLVTGCAPGSEFLEDLRDPTSRNELNERPES